VGSTKEAFTEDGTFLRICGKTDSKSGLLPYHVLQSKHVSRWNMVLWVLVNIVTSFYSGLWRIYTGIGQNEEKHWWTFSSTGNCKPSCGFGFSLRDVGAGAEPLFVCLSG